MRYARSRADQNQLPVLPRLKRKVLYASLGCAWLRLLYLLQGGKAPPRRPFQGVHSRPLREVDCLENSCLPPKPSYLGVISESSMDLEVISYAGSNQGLKAG